MATSNPSFGQKKYELLKDKIDMWPRSGIRASNNELSWHCREVRTGYQFSTNNRGLVKWLRDNFGHGALDQTIPAWMLGTNNKFKKAFIDGYMSADGHKQVLKNGSACHEITTISKKLAFGIKQLLSTLNFIPTIYQSEQHTSFIEGRKVNTNNVYRVKWRPKICESHKQTFTEDGLEWSAIKNNRELNKTTEVYNFSVEDDESYVAEGIVVRWALLKRPRVIMLENVEEFKTWGPTKLNEDGYEFPDSTRAGETFQAFIDMLSTGINDNHPAIDELCEVIKLDRNGTEVKRLIKGLGYKVDFKELKACDFGAPTIRKRFFMVMRCDNQQIVWPEITHGDPRSDEVKAGKLLPYRTAAECIDWSLPCPSIFARKKPLAENTLKRIARGIQRFVISNPTPFIVGAGGPKYLAKPKSVSDPVNTIPMTNHNCLVQPVLSPFVARIGQTGSLYHILCKFIITNNQSLDYQNGS